MFVSKFPTDKDKEIRIVLVGITGKGRRSTQRTIVGDKTADNESPAREKCLMKAKDVAGYKVVVVDTPGLCSFSGDDEKVLKEIKRSIRLLDPGPHVFLYVMDVDKFTPQYQETLDKICDTFGKNILKYTMVLFTHRYKLGDKPIDEFIEENTDLKALIWRCKERYHAIDNKDESPEQVDELLQKIKVMKKKNGGSCYTAKMLQEAENPLNEQPKQQAAALKDIHKAGLAGTAIGCVVGYFVGGGQLTSSIGAAAGALACGILAMVAAGLVIKIKKCISE